ncbi:MAG: diguanylate cyclase, partial [Candidatus Binatia bacterium]
MNGADKGRILVVDDIEENRDVLRRMLERGGHDVLLAGDGDSAIQQAIEGRPDVVILDVRMPGKDGFQVCRELRALAETASIPVVFLTANFGEEADRLLGLELGGFDYLVKPVTRAFLLARVAVMLRIRRSEQEVRRLAMIDGFTGLFTRGYVLQRLAEEIDRGETRSALAMIDLDDFKGCNDRHGHLFGDHVLKRVSELFRANVRRYDSVARFGGDEFLLLHADADEEQAAATIARIRQAIEGERFGSDRSAQVTFSAGVAAVAPGVGVELVLERADSALYVAKRGGRARTVRW